jgi:hypothetical protein
VGGGEKYDLSHLIQLNLTVQEYEWPRCAREREPCEGDMVRCVFVCVWGGGGVILHIDGLGTSCVPVNLVTMITRIRNGQNGHPSHHDHQDQK